MNQVEPMPRVRAARDADGPCTPAPAAAPSTGREEALQAEIFVLQARVRELEAERAREHERQRDELDRFAATTQGWFWEMDAQLRFTYFSPSVERVTGLKPEWHYGRSRAEIGIPQAVTREAWRGHLQTLERREPFRDFVFRRAGPDGLRWIKTSGDPKFDQEGNFLGYRGAAFDVTAEMSAHQNVERLLTAVENLNDIFVLWGPDDRLVLCNARFREMNAGVPSAVLPGTPFESYLRAGIGAGLFPQAAGREEDWLRERLDYHAEPGAAMELERQDGRWLLVREHRLDDGCTVTIATDITKRKRAEASLADKNRVLETALETIPDGVHVLDAELRLAAWNSRLWEVMDLDGDAILADPDPGKAFRYALAGRGEYGPGDVHEVVARREAIARTPVPVHYERRLVTGKWIECRGTPVPGGGYVAVYRDISVVKQQVELERLAAFDDLTGLRNRRSFLEVLNGELGRSFRYGRNLSVMMIDVDRFKPVNDLFGHAAGDHVLRHVSAALAEGMRAMDTLGRYGGEEFAVVLPESDRAQSAHVAERLRGAIESLALEVDGARLAVTVSIGVAELRTGDNSESILARADAALYEAKSAGRNRVIAAGA